MAKFVIKEVSIYKDGSNPMYYPQVEIHLTKETWWWKKDIPYTRWSNLYKVGENLGGYAKEFGYYKDNISKHGYIWSKSDKEDLDKKYNVVVFDKKEDAELFIKNFNKALQKASEEQEKRNDRMLGGLSTNDETCEHKKTHAVNLDSINDNDTQKTPSVNTEDAAG